MGPFRDIDVFGFESLFKFFHLVCKCVGMIIALAVPRLVSFLCSISSMSSYYIFLKVIIVYSVLSFLQL